MAKPTCSVDGCDRPIGGRGWCNAHYQRWRAHGDPRGASGQNAPIRRTRYAFDESYFDLVDTEEKSYWLGFITADGCVRTASGFSTVQIKLKDSDAGHLGKLKSAVGAEHPLCFSARRGVAGPSAMLSLTSRHLIGALMDLGVTPRKSMTAEPWRGPDHLMRHYWRGMIDGDGHIGRESNRNRWSVVYCGSNACVETFSQWARGICGTSSNLYFRSNIWYWKVAGLAAPQALVRELYADASVYLDRKYALAQQLLSEVPIVDRSRLAVWCVVDGCGKKAAAHNMCTSHYRRGWVAAGPDCLVDGCAKKRHSLGYCSMHYGRLRRTGDVGIALPYRRRR